MPPSFLLLSKEAIPGLFGSSDEGGAVFCLQLLLSLLPLLLHICRFGFRTVAAASWEHIAGKCSICRDFTPLPMWVTQSLF